MTATIRPNSKGYKMWLDTFGTDTIEILEGPKPGRAGTTRITVDVKALSVRQFQKLTVALSRKRKISVSLIAEEIVQVGVLLSADGVDVNENSARLLF